MAASLSFLQSATDATDSASFTFSSQSLGAAASDRVIIVAVHSRKLGGATTISVTVGGVSATSADGVWADATNSNAAFLFYADVPSGTTGDVVVTFGESVLRCGIGLWRATGIESTPFDSDSDGFSDVTLSIDVEAGGIAVAAGTHTATTGSMSWLNITEDYDEQIAGEAARQGGASDEYVSAQSALDVSPTFTGSDRAGVAVSWSESAAGTAHERTVFSTAISTLT